MSELIRHEQHYCEEKISPRLGVEVLEGRKDGIETTLINLGQSNAFHRADIRFLKTVLETV